jgi:hypothetical protein
VKYRLIISADSAYVIRKGFITAMLDYVTPCAMLFDNDGYIRAPTRCDLASAVATLGEQCSDIETAITTNNFDEKNRVVECRFGLIELKLGRWEDDVQSFIGYLKKRLDKVATMLELAESGAKQIQQMEQASNRKIDVYGLASVTEGMPTRKWIARQKYIALRVKCRPSMLGYSYVGAVDPYGFFRPQGTSARREYYLKDLHTDSWVWIGDLPRHRRDALKELAQEKPKSIRRIEKPIGLQA